MIHVVATIQTAAGQREAFLAAFRQLVPLVQAEKGCLEYGPTIDLPTSIAAQPPARNDAVVVVEKWENVADLEAHLVAPHVQRFRENVKQLVQGTEILVLQPA